MAEQHTTVGAGSAGGDVLPSGTVTFLFTDIEGSTRLLREDREAYATALADHRRLVRTAVAAHGGRVVDTQGDSFFVAFSTPGQAVAAAASAQRSLAAQPWPDGVRVLVRMGLHTGEATVAAGGYVGLAVHRAARIAAVASGGQVVLSAATAALAGEQLPPDTALRSLGEHRLKDFPQPAVLYQLDIAGLPTHFPPLRTTPRHQQLPVPAGELLGRDADVATLAALLTRARTRLVTVTGPGGIGKTRLALETARTVAGEFPGGVVFAPLSPVTDPRLVLSTVADAVGARPEPGQALLDAVRAVLEEERTLLVLDNLEQVVAAGGELATLLDAVPAAVALVTSRTALRLRLEQRFPLAPLAATPAERLFTERAAAVRPGFTLDDRSAAVVAEICRRLDGLPLAIELAAARVRLLPPAALLARLSERLDVLGGGPVDLPERQQTLRATMDWSFGLLPPHEQAVFTRLAVFSGGWTPAAAETVCGRPGEPAVLDALSALLDASLLVESDVSAPQPRLSMLETVRTYAAERLAASPDRPETERRHTGWVLAMIDSAVPAGEDGFREALDRLDRERANVRAAVQRAIDAADVETAAQLIRNSFAYLVARRDAEREALVWLDQVLARVADGPPATRGRLLVLRAIVAGIVGDLPAVRPLLEEGRRLLPGDAYDRAGVAVASVYAALAEGSVDEASRWIDEMADRFASLGPELALQAALGSAFATMLAGNVALIRGDLEGAERHFGRALELVGRVGDEVLVGQVLSLRGLILLARGDGPGGRRSILEGAEVNRRGGQPLNIAYSLEGLAALALADGRPAVAARAVAAAVAARRHVPLGPALTPLSADLPARSREQLGDQAYEAACAEGRQWSALQALNRTLEELAGTGPPPGTATGTCGVERR